MAPHQTDGIKIQTPLSEFWSVLQERDRLRKLASVVDIYLYAQTELGHDPEGALREALEAARAR